MKFKSFPRIFVFFLLVLLLNLLVGCNQLSNQSTESTIRISMYNSASFPKWRNYVEEMCPDINIIWENNRNNIGNLIYNAQHGDMADIVSI